MSTVLTKPVLLDETGQAIVGKLQDIQQAIGGTGEFIPINIRVTTPPTKTNYLAGETLDLSGMVVTLVANNGGMYDVTGDCVFSPADGSVVTSSTTEVNISYTWYKDSTVFTAKQPIEMKELASIAVTTSPTVTEYDVGDTLDLTGIVVTATFADGSTANVTNQCTYIPAEGDILGPSNSSVLVSLTLGGITETATQAIEVYGIFGAEWDGTASSAWTRTDGASNLTDPIPYYSGMAGEPSSPFDSIAPWKDIKLVSDDDAGDIVEIPKFWYKWTRESAKMKLQISNKERTGFLVSPAHSDRGDGQGERDKIYVGAYLCNSALKSLSGETVEKKTTPAWSSAFANNNNSEIWGWDFATYWTICMLYLVEFADWNSQAKIGKGGYNGGQSTTGQTSAFDYHTGTNSTNPSSPGSYPKYRYIEGLWGCGNVLTEGIYGNGSAVMCEKNPSKFVSDRSSPSGAQNIGVTVPTFSYLSGTITAWTQNPSVQGYEWAIIPKTVEGGNNEYVCDWLAATLVYQTYWTGGDIESGADRVGLFWAGGNNSNGNTTVRTRLMKLPANS